MAFKKNLTYVSFGFPSQAKRHSGSIIKFNSNTGMVLIATPNELFDYAIVPAKSCITTLTYIG